MTGVEAPSLLRAAGSLALVLLGVLAIAWLLRRWSPVGVAQRDVGRLVVVTAQSLDARSRLVLIQRDGVEHLLVVAPSGVTLIETIVQPASRAAMGAEP